MVSCRVLIIAGILLIWSAPVFACNFGDPNYQECAYREMMRNTGSDNRTLSSRRNPSGGFDFSDGTTCQRNPSGGLDCRR